MKVSILIHNLNRASILERCLSSAENLDYRPLEVIILDAGSTDNSADIINSSIDRMYQLGISAHKISCKPMGVPASRNFAARHASGKVLCFIDNDASFTSSNSISCIVKHFRGNNKLAVVSFRILNGDTAELDPFAWVFRRPEKIWSFKQFKTFTFTGGGFCILSDAFSSAGGFWEQLQYSREEEELALALIDKGYEIMYSPDIIIRHYPDNRGRTSITQRRFVELKNGILVLWRKLPAPIALFAIAGRICTMSLKMIVLERKIPGRLFFAVIEAIKNWSKSNLQRAPISYNSFMQYLRLHFQR